MTARCLAFVIAGLLPLASGAVEFGPDAQLLQSAQHALRDCEVRNAAELFDSTSLAYINLTKLRAERADLASEDFDYDLENHRLFQHLRAQPQPLGAERVFAALCSDPNGAQGERWALRSLRTASALLGEQVAWVPLLTAEGEYLGLGLVFVLEGASWRLVWQGLNTPFSSTPASAELARRMREPAPRFADYGAIPSDCTRPTAPAAESVATAVEEALDEARSADLPGPANELGRLQRAAARRYAEGIEVPSSAAAQVIFAEVLVRSLWFDDAPKADDPRWERRIDRALRFAEQAFARGADLTRFAPIGGWIGDVYFYGEGGARIDFARAERAYQLGARSGDEDASKALADMQASALTSLPVKVSVNGAAPRWNSASVLAELSELKAVRGPVLSEERDSAPPLGYFESPEALEIPASCRW